MFSLGNYLNGKMLMVEINFKKNQKALIWQRYLMAMITGTLASLLTDLLWMLCMR
jgi:hypothetical protein